VRGRLADLDDRERRLLLERRSQEDPALEQAVRALLAEVRQRGDEALRAMARRFDGVALGSLEVPHARWTDALDALDGTVRRALERAVKNIGAFHRAQVPSEVSLETEPGVRLSRRFSPLARVGVYAPGGTAAYPSSVLMGVVAARAAGVPEVVVCSPPGPGGEPPAAVLAAAALAGADRLFALGGAGAVAAMTFGTESVPRCAAVVGPGNRWVTEAKRQVAAELVAQAEHDPDAAALLVTTSPELLEAVERALVRQIAIAPRRDVVAAALRARGALLLAEDLAEALAFAGAYAAEHLALFTSDPERALRGAGAAGTVFLGEASSVAFGDYLTGANHVLPTAGSARSWSGLSALSFLRSWTVQELTPEAARSLAADTSALAEAEGLPGHAAAARLRGPA
jgi:histidinol dehydrogenase